MLPRFVGRGSLSPMSPSPQFLLRPLVSDLRRLSTAASSASTLLHVIRSHTSPPPLEALLPSLIPSHPSPSLIPSLLHSLSPSHPLLSLRLFLWSSLRSPPLLRPSTTSLSSLSSSLSLPLNPHLLPSLLDSYSLDGLPLPSRSFSLLLSLCLHSDLPFPLALSLLRRMPHFGSKPDVPIYNSLLRLRSATTDDAIAILKEMKCSGLRPDLITYVTVIKKLCEKGRLVDAREMLEEMRADGCSPNVVVYSALIDGACNCGDLGYGFEILEQMEKERDGKCGPNVVSYTCLMKCLCESGRLEEALGVLDRMGLNGVEPNRVTLRTLLKGFCDKGRVDEAYRIVESMVGKERGVSSRECYSMLVVCLLRAGDWEGAQGLFGRMLERGIRPDGVACNSVMREICKRRCFLDGYNWIGVLEEKGASFVDSDVYSCLLAGLCEEGHMVEAVKLGRNIVENGVRIEDAYVECIVEAMEKVGECHLASEILKMKEENKSELIEEN